MRGEEWDGDEGVLVTQAGSSAEFELSGHCDECK